MDKSVKSPTYGENWLDRWGKTVGEMLWPPTYEKKKYDRWEENGA